MYKRKDTCRLTVVWLEDVMEIVSSQQSEYIKMKISQEVIDGIPYAEALEDGKKELLKILSK